MASFISNLKRQAGIRRCLIVHGETRDIVSCDETNDYRPIPEVIVRTLKRSGFNEIVMWDQHFGVQIGEETLSLSAWRELAAAATPAPQQAPQQTPVTKPYDMGGVPGQAPARQPPWVPQSARDMLTVAYHHMANPNPGRRRYAFVLDWSDYLFGNSNAPSEEERDLLLMLSKAMRDAPLGLDRSDGLERPDTLLVLLCARIGPLPPALYQGNPAVQEIVVPSPTRGEREAFLKFRLGWWNLRVVLKPGELAFSDFVDLLEGLSLRDMQQLMKLSRQTETPLSPERLVNLYRYGEQKSPWEDLNREKLRTIEESLGARVKGQDDAIRKLRSVIIRAYTGLSGLQHSRKQRMPKGILFFVGPTGVGKTELAKALAQFLFGDEDACIRFDMSEFNHEQSDQRLVGSPPGYVGHSEGGQLTNAVKRRPFSVILFDEIEKAHVRILDKFLQILEDGRLTDGRGETVQFSETVIIFTSNIGAAEIALQDDVETVKAQFIEKVREHFFTRAQRPELLNRIGDNIVPFNFITDSKFLVSIAKSKLAPLRDRLREKYRINDLRFQNEEAALETVVASVDRQMGGRGVLNELVKRVFDPLSEFLFEEEEDPGHYAERTVRGLPTAAGPFQFALE